AIVTIKHVVTVDLDNINFYHTVIDPTGTLIIKASDHHRFGKISGTGTIRLLNTGILPSGNYTNFFGCDGGKIDFNAAAGFDYEILANMPPIEQVTLSGFGGRLTIASSAVNVCRNLRVNGGGVPGLFVSAAN